jgi:dihydroorotate dehydrogenase
VIYRWIFNLVFKPMPPETAHWLVDFGLGWASKLGLIRAAKRPKPIRVMGLDFENRLGLGAGFDKNARLIRPMHALGFGHVELGTVTAQAQPGNPKPRSFRIPEHDALINRMGFNNDGAEQIAQRVSHVRSRFKNLPVIGINVGKTKLVDPQDAVEDYRFSTRAVAGVADYLAVNVSSPNTPGLRDLQQVETLRPILVAVQEESMGKPVLVKIAPDLADEDFHAVLGLVMELGLTGVILANTTISREGVGDSPVKEEAGGLSGPVLAPRAIDMLVQARAYLGGEYVIISVGGITTAEQARERVALGADLVQVYTGFIYGGPFWPRRLARALQD